PGGQGPARERFYERVGGAEGAAFVTCALLTLQDSPVDGAYYYTADTNPFGLFTRHGVPRPTFHAFRAFRTLIETPDRLATSGAQPGRLAVGAGMSRERDEVTVLIGNVGSAADQVLLRIDGLSWDGEADFEVRRLDGDHAWGLLRAGRLPVGAPRMTVPLKAPAVGLIAVRRTLRDEPHPGVLGPKPRG
ncbi:MAG TPA: hypothetical protein VF590_14535, partial [Isosphaeraceae bacterium]